MPAVMQLASKSVGMTSEEFVKAMENGEISAKKFLPAFTKALREMAAPGLAKAMQTVSLAQKQLTANWKLFKDSIFTSGLGEFFKELFYTLDDFLVILKPIAIFLISTLTTFLRAVLFPIRAAIALIADLIDNVNYYLKKFLGFNLDDVAKTIGKIVGSVLSLIAGGAGLISTFFRGLSRLSIFRIIPTVLGKALEYLRKISPMIDQIIAKLKSLPMIGRLFKAASVGDGAQKASMGSNILNKTLDYGTMVGSVFSSGLVGHISDAIGRMSMENGKVVVDISLKDSAADTLQAQTKTQTTDKILSNVR